MTGDLHVTYPVKELLEKIDGRVADVQKELRSKASQAEMIALAKRVETLEKWQWRASGVAAVGVIIVSVVARHL